MIISGGDGGGPAPVGWLVQDDEQRPLPHQPASPGRLTEFLGEDVPPPVAATTAVLAEGQLRGEVRADEPAESLAVILLYAVLFSARRGVTIGRPLGSTALSRLALQVTLRGMRP